MSVHRGLSNELSSAHHERRENFIYLDGFTEILLEEEEVWRSVCDSKLPVHVGITEVELCIQVHAAKILVRTESTGHRAYRLTAVTSEEDDGGGFVRCVDTGFESIVNGVVEILAFDSSEHDVIRFGHYLGLGEVQDVLVTITQVITTSDLPFSIGTNEGGFVAVRQVLHMNLQSTK